MNAADRPVDELPNGLPLFNIFLHLPAFSAQLQLFRLVHSYVIDRFTLHTLLVHPEELEAVPQLAAALAFLQLHGEVWLVQADASTVTLGRVGRPVEYRIRATDRDRVSLVDGSGASLADEDRRTLLHDDDAKLRLLRECFLREYDDHALSVPLVRAYPGRTSLILRTRPFWRLFATDPVGPGTNVRDVWASMAGSAGG